jgi:hypothetical protein
MGRSEDTGTFTVDSLKTQSFKKEILPGVGFQVVLNWGQTKVERRQIKHEPKNKAVFRP